MTELATGAMPNMQGPMFDADEEATGGETTEAAPKKAGLPDAETERQELIAAANKALEKPGEKASEEKPKEPKVEAKKPAEPKAEGEPDTAKSKLARELERREKETALLSEADKKRQEASSLYEQAQALIRDAQEAKRAADAELAEMKRLRANPYDAMGKLGWSADDIIEAANRQKDPNFQSQIKFESELSKRDEYIAKLEQRLSRIEGVAETYETQTKTAAQRQAEDQFFAAIPQDSPALKLWDKGELLQKAIAVQQQVKAKTNRVASPAEIAEYLDYQGREKIKSLVTPAEVPGSSSSSAGKAKANTRAPASRENREAPPKKPPSQMTPAEEREWLIAEVERQMRGDAD